MIYYEDYRLKIVETDGKYTVYDEKIGSRAYYVNKSKEWIDEYIQRVQSKRKRKPSGKLIREVLNDFSVGLNSGSMTREEVKNYIEHMDKNELVKLCEDIYQWRYETGKLKPDCALNKLAECLQYWEIKDIEEIVIEVATKRFNEVVLLLFKSNPNNYLQ